MSRKRWWAYWQSNLAQAVDRQVDLPRIERWIEMSDEYEKVNAILKQTRLVKGSVGQPTLNPLVGYLSVLLQELRAAETELGTTPLARQRLGIAYGQARLTARDLNRLVEERRGQRERASPRKGRRPRSHRASERQESSLQRGCSLVTASPCALLLRQ